MKIKVFVAREIQYFELGIFYFNSYVYYLTRAFNVTTRAFSLLNRGSELVTRRFELVTRRFELVTRGFELVTRGFELVTPVLLFYSNNVSKMSLNFEKQFISGFCYYQKRAMLLAKKIPRQAISKLDN